jgi:hypothetical protein
MNNHKFIGFEENLNSDDYGIIISPDGKIKGILMPSGKDKIHQTVAHLCLVNFGIDPTADETVSMTLH